MTNDGGVVGWFEDKAEDAGDALEGAGDWVSDNASDLGHGALDVAGLVPVLGEVADLGNAAWYAAEGDYANAALSAASAIPLAGYGASAIKAGKYAKKGVDAVQAGQDAASAARTASKFCSFGARTLGADGRRDPQGDLEGQGRRPGAGPRPADRRAQGQARARAVRPPRHAGQAARSASRSWPRRSTTRSGAPQKGAYMRADQLAAWRPRARHRRRLMRVKGIEAGQRPGGDGVQPRGRRHPHLPGGGRGVLVHNSCGSSVPRNADGTFAPRNGEPGRAGAADEATAMDQLAMDGAKVQRGQQSVQVDGFPRRNYDGAAQVDGKWLGVETKGGYVAQDGPAEDIRRLAEHPGQHGHDDERHGARGGLGRVGPVTPRVLR